jgi:hypothetical protein
MCNNRVVGGMHPVQIVLYRHFPLCFVEIVHQQSVTIPGFKELPRTDARRLWHMYYNQRLGDVIFSHISFLWQPAGLRQGPLQRMHFSPGINE